MDNSRALTALLAAAAVGGILTGSAIAQESRSNEGGMQIAQKEKAGKKGTGSEGSVHECAGKNACKGKGGCQTGDNGCKGKNSCKGKGGCSTKEKK